MGFTYKDAGVDIDAGDRLVERIRPLAARTSRPEVLAGVGGFGQGEQVAIAGFGREVDDAARLVVGRADGAAAGAGAGEVAFGGGEAALGEAQEDEAEHRGGVFGTAQAGVGAQAIGGVPEALFEVGDVGGQSLSPVCYAVVGRKNDTRGALTPRPPLPICWARG